MTLKDLLKLIAKPADKEELLYLVDQYYNAVTVPGHIGSSNSSAIDLQQQEALNKIMERLHWHFRAIRHPLPTQQELEEMIIKGMSKDEQDDT